MIREKAGAGWSSLNRSLTPWRKGMKGAEGCFQSSGLGHCVFTSDGCRGGRHIGDPHMRVFKAQWTSLEVSLSFPRVSRPCLFQVT